MAGNAVVPVHPEATDDSHVLLWRVSHALAADLDSDAPSAAAAAALTGLLADGTLAAFAVEDAGIRTTLAPGLTWAQAGPVVRRAVQRSVAAHADLLHEDGVRDAALARIARQVVEDVVAPAATAHGGSIEFVQACDGVVQVRTHGACHGCPVAPITLHGLLAGQVRRRAPWLADVRETA